MLSKNRDNDSHDIKFRKWTPAQAGQTTTVATGSHDINGSSLQWRGDSILLAHLAVEQLRRTIVP